MPPSLSGSHVEPLSVERLMPPSVPMNTTVAAGGGGRENAQACVSAWMPPMPENDAPESVDRACVESPK
jgi:hypothetical protein